MANTFNLGNGNWAQKTEKLLAYNAENDNYKPLPFDFDRGSTATRVNRDGLIETVGVDEPRIDFLNNSKGHLLLEPQRTNLITYSEDLTTGWTTSAATITADTQISPDGNQTADTITVTANSGGVYSDNITVIASTSYTFSFYVKRGTISDSETALAVRNQTAGTFINIDTSYSASADNWTRIEHTFTTPVGCTSVRLYPQRLSNGGQGTIFVWGAQLEQGSYATSYIPTSGSAVTRSVDAIEQSGFQGKVMNATQGTIFIHFDNPIEDGDNNDFHMFRSTGGSGIENGFLFRLNTGTGVDILERVSNATGAQFQNIVVKGQENKIAISFTSSTFLASGNGATKSYTGTYLGTEIDIDEFQNSGSTAQGFNIIDMKFYDTALTQEELNALTTI